MIRVGEYMYWYGENRQDKTRVSCYRSTNMIDWEFRGDLLTLDSPFRKIDTWTNAQLTDAETGKGSNIERPKIVYNPTTGKFVMWMHWENGNDYSAARCAIATCDTIDGKYVYHGSFNPVGNMSRDCTLFVDDDGTAYFITASRGNADLHIYSLGVDFLSIDEHVKTLWPGQYREAPAMVKRNGVYFLVTSGCTGWEPNQGKYAFAHSISGKWSGLYDFGGPTTYDTQPTQIITLQGEITTNYLYLGDRWDPSNYQESSYAILPLEFPDEKTIALTWFDSVSIRTDSGLVQTGRSQSGLYRFSNSSHRYLSLQEEAQVAARKLSYSTRSQMWMIEPMDGGYVRIRNAECNRYLQPLQCEENESSAIVLTDQSDNALQQWNILDPDHSGWCMVQNRSSGNVLTLRPEFEGFLHAAPMKSLENCNGQKFLLTEHYGR